MAHCFVMCTKIDNSASILADKKGYALTGAAVHELGHSLGIFSDDSETNPNENHGGNQIEECVMHSPLRIQ